MCGITVFKKIDTKELCDKLDESWIMLNHRGTDSFGLMLVKDGEIKTLKSLKQNKIINKLKSRFEGEEFDLVIAHNRKASIGGVSIQLAHPIKIGNIIVIHNGTNSKLTNIITDAKSDTQAIASILNRRHNPFVRKYINDWLSGSGVIIAYDMKKKKWLFWKDKTRPLVKSVSNGYYCSEPIELDESYRIIDNTDYLIESRRFDNLFRTGRKFRIEDLLYPGHCSICNRMMLIEESSITKWKTFNEEGVCWECRALKKQPKRKFWLANKSKHDSLSKCGVSSKYLFDDDNDDEFDFSSKNEYDYDDLYY